MFERHHRPPGELEALESCGDPRHAAAAAPQLIMRCLISAHKHGVFDLFCFMSASAKVWRACLRKFVYVYKSLCLALQKKPSMWVYTTMDCLKGIYNGIGIRFFMMALLKLWTLIMYVVRRNLKTVCFCKSRMCICYL